MSGAGSLSLWLLEPAEQRRVGEAFSAQPFFERHRHGLNVAAGERLEQRRARLLIGAEEDAAVAAARARDLPRAPEAHAQPQQAFGLLGCNRAQRLEQRL